MFVFLAAPIGEDGESKLFLGSSEYDTFFALLSFCTNI